MTEKPHRGKKSIINTETIQLVTNFFRNKCKASELLEKEISHSNENYPKVLTEVLESALENKRNGKADGIDINTKCLRKKIIPAK